MARKLSILAPDWWDFTTLDDEILDDAAALTPEDMLALSRPGFNVVYYDTLEDLYLAEALAAAGKKVVAFNGARSASLLPLRLLPTGAVRDDGVPSHSVAEFAAWGVDSAIATDDGSLGFHGLVGEPFKRWLAQLGDDAQSTAVYTCGPEAMMKAVAQIASAAGATCQVSLERHMACGMGTCQSCVVRVRDNEDSDGWRYRLCCTDGPVFDSRLVMWDE